MFRIDNRKRLHPPPTIKRLAEGGGPENAKRKCKDEYGCVYSDLKLSVGETRQLQKEKQEELLNMHKNKDKNSKKIEQLILETSSSQRRDLWCHH